MEQKKADLEVKFEHAENKNTKEAIEGLKSLLEVEKKKGNLDFKVVTKRKCDFCERTLTDKDKFTTEKDGDNILDKCEKCKESEK